MRNLKRLLLVDDDPISLRILRQLLETLGYQVVVAHNGQEAVTLFQKNPFPFILTDFNMPIMDGPSAVKEIRRLERGKKSFILGLTASTDPEYRALGLTSGMDLVYHKPVDVALLRGVFGDHAETHDSFGEYCLA